MIQHGDDSLIICVLHNICRPVGSGAAWRWSPHQKSAGREREKEEKGGKKGKRGERKKRGEKRKVMARRARAKDVGLLRLYRCKTPP